MPKLSKVSEKAIRNVAKGKGIIVNGKYHSFPYGIHSAKEWAASMKETLQKIKGTVIGTPKTIHRMKASIKLLKSL